MLCWPIREKESDKARIGDRPQSKQKASPVRLNKLRRKVRRQARSGRLDGSMTEAQYQASIAICKNEKALAELNNRVENEVNPWNRTDGLIGASWREIWANIADWFKENWPAILRIILTILPLLLLEPEHEDS